MHLPMSNQCSERGGWERRCLGQGFGRSLWPRLGHLNYLALLGVGIFEFLFVPVTKNHFPGWGISVIFDLTFLPWGREFDSNFLENVKIPSYALPPPAGLTLKGALRPWEAQSLTGKRVRSTGNHFCFIINFPFQFFYLLILSLCTLNGYERNVLTKYSLQLGDCL